MPIGQTPQVPGCIRTGEYAIAVLLSLRKFNLIATGELVMDDFGNAVIPGYSDNQVNPYGRWSVEGTLEQFRLTHLSLSLYGGLGYDGWQDAH